MPRKAPTQVIENRHTFGTFERQWVVEQEEWVKTRLNIASVGVIAVPIGVVIGGCALGYGAYAGMCALAGALPANPLTMGGALWDIRPFQADPVKRANASRMIAEWFGIWPTDDK